MQMRLLFALPALFVVACRNDPPPSPEPAAQPSVTTPAAIAPASAAPVVSTGPEPAASAAPLEVASAMPSASAAAAPAPKATVEKKTETKKEPAKPETTPEPTPALSASAIASAVAAPVPASPADAIAAQIDVIFADKKTFSAKFKQEHTQKISGVTKKSTGMFFFERPNKMSFRYDDPSKNRIVSDGSTLKVYIGEDNQMFVQNVDKTEYPGAFAFLMGKGLAPSFTFTFNEKSKFEGGPVLLGKPRQETPHYDSVFFYVDKQLLEKKDPGVIRRILIVDTQGNRNRFDLEGATQPDKIDSAEFTFTPPPGTNITQN